MKKIILSCLFLVSIVMGDSWDIEINDLKKIDKYTIEIGKGKSIEYLFVDPDCKFSKKFIQKIYSNKEILKDTTYRIVLAKLNKFHSEAKINYIMHAKNKEKALKEIMLKNIRPKRLEKENNNISEEEKEILSFCKKNEIKSRPFTIAYNDIED